MKHSIVRLPGVSIGAVPFVVMVVAMPILGARQQSVTPDQFISGPSEWVPLTYEWEDRVNGVLNDTYVEYRSANGSTRQDRRDAEIRIADVPSGKYFVLDRHGWRQHPLRAQIGNGKPFVKLKRSTVTPVAQTDPRVQLIAGLVGISVTFYEMPMRVVGGDENLIGKLIGSTIFCPELNMLDVWERHTRQDGVVEKIVTNIRLGEPLVDWAPPADARITITWQAAGPGH